MGKLLILTSCCIIIAASELDTSNFLSFQDAPMPGHVEAVKDKHMKDLFAQLLGKRSLQVGPNGLPEVMFLHNQLQNKLGWGSDDDNGRNNKNNNQQYGPPPNQNYGPPPPSPNQNYGPPPNQQYGPPPNQNHGPPPPPPNQNYGPPPPPPNQNYGPPPSPPNQQYGPPPSAPNQQYGPPPSAPNQQYGPPPSAPNQQYGPPPNQNYGPPPSPPNQQYGPPPSPPNQQYGPPPSPPNQQYGPPPSQQQNQPSQEYGPPNDNNKLRVNQGTFGGHIENFKLTDAVRNNNNKNNDYSGPPPSKSAPSSQYGSPAFSDNSGYNNNGLDNGGSSDNAKIYKHVYIHTPPQEQEEELEPRVIRPNKKQDTHYQIIFVKAPGPAKQAPLEVELPSAPERKTLVYVLVKKPEKPAEIKFRAPPATQPPKPEVYFIRYKGKNGKKGDRPEDLLSQIDAKDIISSNSRPSQVNDINDEEGYSLRGNDDDSIRSSILSSMTKDRDSVGYPNAEYRAMPSMLSPNDEPMSFAVYDRVRNEKVPSSPAGGLVTSASNLDLIVRRSSRKFDQKIGGSHYTAPGSLPFVRPSGRMTNGQYLGMTSNILRNQYYSPPDDVK